MEQNTTHIVLMSVYNVHTYTIINIRMLYIYGSLYTHPFSFFFVSAGQYTKFCILRQYTTTPQVRHNFTHTHLKYIFIFIYIDIHTYMYKWPLNKFCRLSAAAVFFNYNHMYVYALQVPTYTPRRRKTNPPSVRQFSIYTHVRTYV